MQASLEESPLLLDHCFFRYAVVQEHLYITIQKRNETHIQKRNTLVDSTLIPQQEWKNWILWQKKQLVMLEEKVDHLLEDETRTVWDEDEARIVSPDIVENSLSAEEDSEWAASSESSATQQLPFLKIPPRSCHSEEAAEEEEEEKAEEEDESEEERESRKRKEEEAAEKLKKRKKRKKMNFQKIEAEESEKPEVWLDQELPYAQQWLEQEGDDSGIPKKYTPCKSFFRDSCWAGSKCEFSHNENIFLNDPFAACLKNICQRKKRKKRKGCNEEVKKGRSS